MGSRRSVRTKVAIGAPALGMTLALATEAAANGRIPAGHQLVVSPADPTFLVMETTFGLLFSHDTGKTFGWVCEAPIGYGGGGQQDPSVGMTSTSVLAGLREGLAVSTDRGCSWTLAPTDPVVDIVVRPDDPHTALALTTIFAAVSDASMSLFTTRVLVTHDDGAHWAQQGVEIDPEVVVDTIEVARSDPNRIYVGGQRPQREPDGSVDRIAVVLASSDEGATYSPHTIALAPPFETSLGAAFVSAVDPQNPDRLYVRIGDSVADRLIVSDDGGVTFRTVYQAKGPLLAFALSSDGSEVFVGGPRDGVVAAPAYAGDADTGFIMQSSAMVSCLAWIGGELYACMGEPQNSFLKQLGVSTDEGKTFAAKFYFACMSGAVGCPASTVATICNPGLPALIASIGPCDEDGAAQSIDASSGGGGGGAEDAAAHSDGGSSSGLNAGAVPPSRKTAPCGCGAGEAAGAGALFVLGSLGAIPLIRRRRGLH